MGTPDFAVPSLKRLVADGHQVAAVYTNPDKPKNRGMKMTPSPVKVAALEAELPVIQPTTLKDEAVFAELNAFAPELIVVAAYGKLLPNSILELPKYGCINVHSSLLPKYRGAAPINWAMVNGEKETGVTIMYMAQALDAGDIISQRVTPIEPEENAEELYTRLAELGAELLSETVVSIANGTATRTPQDDSQHTYAPMLSRELSPIDWSSPAQSIHDQIRGLVSWPATTFELEGKTFKAYASVLAGETSKEAGTLLGSNKQGILYACGDGKVLCITELQAPGKKRMKAADFLRGHQI
jgi:methionyl-tRNA formyltransferase